MSLHVDLKYTQLISPYCERFVRKKDYLFNMRCPFCGDSEIKQTKMRGYIYRNKKNQQRLRYKCHNCQVNVWIGELIKHLSPQLYKEYLLENFQDKQSPRTMPVKGEIVRSETVRFGKIDVPIFQYAEKVSDLPEAHYCRVYVKGRGIPTEHWSRLYYADNFKDFVGEVAPEEAQHLRDEPRLVIPYFDQFGAIYAVSGRALTNSPQRYLTIRTTKEDVKLVYGLERVNQDLPVQVVEGPLDSLFLPNAVASGDANLILAARRLSAAQITLIYDNERRSKEIVRQMERAINLSYSVVVWPKWIIEKDINAMILGGYSQDELQSIIHRYTFSGLTATLELAWWKKVMINKGVMI